MSSSLDGTQSVDTSEWLAGSGDHVQIVERDVAPKKDEIPRGEQSTLGSDFGADLHLDNQATTEAVPLLSSSSTKHEDELNWVDAVHQ